ncbi:hypothetical protein AVO45_05550 [Ruegeria marisrubri]|uniref:Uncharacterized protein n=1 Tax=Ruegeria marisrubri TaxID=1685379 RepID=A0A0X3TXP9_9RHOB|nr:hypothetical protein [Ruegeria marisrubri]KUJ80513.1 hypothetical protein AVO45_05550 [Ruegeria marisrubri]
MIRVVLALLLLAWSSGAMAEERSSLWPDVPAATGEPHPEGNEYWRKNHMALMKHDRDLTMHLGDREIGASLKGCFECHTTTNASGKILTYADEGHFCRTCHDFAAVKVDCFSCHRSTPEGVEEDAQHAAIRPEVPGGEDGRNEILAYLQRAAGKEAEK